MRPAAGSGAVTVLVLAGRRDGAIDPLAQAAGTDLKCLVPVAGRAMILHVLDALAQAPSVDRIIVSTNDADALAALPQIAAMRAAGRLEFAASRANLVDSVLDALAGVRFPVLVTTADNVLLTADAVAQLAEGAGSCGAAVAVAFARRDAVLAAHPEGQRRFYRFSDDAYSGCNSYWIGSGDALRIAELFRGGGQFAKFPMRIVRAFGLLNLIRFRFGIGTLEEAFARFSRRFRLRIAPIIFPDGAIAIDVDNARTLAIATALLNERGRAR